MGLALTANDELRLKRWRISTFWVMLLGYVGYYLCRKNISAAFPLIEQEFGYTNTQLGMIAAFSEVAYAAGKFINGPLADKVGGRRMFLLGMVGAIFFNIVFAFSSSLAMFIAVWCGCRYFLSMGWGGLAKTIGNWYPPERNGTVMGLISINFQFGGVVATLFAGYLVAIGVGWQGVFIYPAIVLTGVLIWSYFCSKGSPQDVVPGYVVPSKKQQAANYESEDEKADVKTILLTLIKLPLFRHVLLFSFLTTLMRSFFFFWTPKFLVDIGMGTSNAIIKSALFPFLGCLGTVFLGWYTDRYAKKGDRAKPMWIMLIGLFISLLWLAFAITNTEVYNYPLIITLLGACGFFLLGPYSMSSGCLALDIAGAKGAGSCTGMIDGMGYIGGAIAAFGTGVLADHMGWPEVFQFLALFAVLSAFSAFMMSRRFQKDNA